MSADATASAGDFSKRSGGGPPAADLHRRPDRGSGLGWEYLQRLQEGDEKGEDQENEPAEGDCKIEAARLREPCPMQLDNLLLQAEAARNAARALEATLRSEVAEPGDADQDRAAEAKRVLGYRPTVGHRD